MKDRKLSKKIREIPIPDYEEDAFLRTLSAAKEADLHPERQRVTKAEFFAGRFTLSASLGTETASHRASAAGNPGDRTAV